MVVHIFIITGGFTVKLDSKKSSRSGNILNLNCLFNLLTWSVPDEGYCRNASCKTVVKTKDKNHKKCFQTQQIYIYYTKIIGKS